jgi:AraC-like DNA-binding protein
VHRTVEADPPRGLERSCTLRADRISVETTAHGIERADVYLARQSFDLHRHETYGLGMTTTGVQTFRYRGARHVSLPGQLHFLHPDEGHDGAPATDGGFGYRILHIAPEIVREAIGGRALPFVAEPVQDASSAAASVAAMLRDADPIDALRAAEIAAAAAYLLRALSGRGERPVRTVDLAAMERVREFLDASACDRPAIAELEAVAGLDRFTIARQFRWAFGMSPTRYRTQRQVAQARTAIERGYTIAEAASTTGFTDQSHLTRHFKRTYGLTPGRWRALTSGTPGGHPPHATARSRA